MLASALDWSPLGGVKTPPEVAFTPQLFYLGVKSGFGKPLFEF
jgi:hypothetical protein